MGLTDIMNKVEGFKAEANNLVAAKHTEAGQYVETTRMNTLQQIEQQQPNIPIYSKLPKFVQEEILKRGEEEFKSDI